jgi:hypothetical protein
MLKRINIFFQKYVGYIILITLLIFVSYRLLHQPESTKLLKKELNLIKKQKDSVIEADKILMEKFESIKKENKYYIRQNVILSKRLRIMLKDIDEKIKKDEKNIDNIDNITESNIDSILSNYRFTPFKTTKN